MPNGGIIGTANTPTQSVASGIWSVRDVHLARVGNIWPIVDDPYFANVTALFHFDGSDGSTTFTDSSSSPKTATASGDAQIDTAQSKFGGASLLLDGTGDYVSIASVPAFGTSDFTVEFWLRLASASTCGLWECRPDGENFGNYPLIYNNAGTLTYWAGGERIAGGSLSTNTWYHIAVSRSGTSTKMFLNGTQVGSTYSDSINYVTRASQLIGKLHDGYNASAHFDDLRITGGTGRYTANFTPPTAPHPNA